MMTGRLVWGRQGRHDTNETFITRSAVPCTGGRSAQSGAPLTELKLGEEHVVEATKPWKEAEAFSPAGISRQLGAHPPTPASWSFGRMKTKHRPPPIKTAAAAVQLAADLTTPAHAVDFQGISSAIVHWFKYLTWKA